ncbi:MAG: FHA domain-containing protein [Holophagales bacterium]|nr:FHA domain-containing protein [Holophagales bacterium]
MAKLLIHESTGIREFELVDDDVRIGREFDNNLRIADASVSRYHAAVRREGRNYTIVDLESVNGITVMGRKVAMAALSDGAQFNLGQVKIIFQDKNGASTKASVPSGGAADSAPRVEKAHQQRQPGNEPHTITVQSGGISDTPRMVFRPGADAASACILTLFLLGAGHMIVNGQQRKWAFNVLALFLASIVSCILAHLLPPTAFGGSNAGIYAVLLIWLLPMIIIHVLYSIDAFMTGKSLRYGRTLHEDEYSLPLLYSIVRIFDKMARRGR